MVAWEGDDGVGDGLFLVFLSRLCCSPLTLWRQDGGLARPLVFCLDVTCFLLAPGLVSNLPAVTNGLDPLKMRLHTLAFPLGRDRFDMEGSGLYSSHRGIVETVLVEDFPLLRHCH